MSPVNRDDVARKAGVSSATVSRAYNTPEKVRPEKRERILSVASKLGYVPDKHASALRKTHGGTILFLEPAAWNRRLNRNYLWVDAMILKGVIEAIESSIYSLRIATFEKQNEIPSLLTESDVSGVIHLGHGNPRVLKKIHGVGIPAISVYQGPPLDAYTTYTVDEFEGGRIAAEVFQEHGYTRPMHITSEGDGIANERMRGFLAGWEERDVWIIREGLGIAQGYAAGKKAVPHIKKGEADCLFVVNDLTAVGVLQAFREEGVHVPHDIAVIAYDNQPFIETLPQTLATFDIRFKDIFHDAVLALIAKIQGDDTPVSVGVPPLFVAGETLTGTS